MKHLAELPKVKAESVIAAVAFLLVFGGMSNAVVWAFGGTWSWVSFLLGLPASIGAVFVFALISEATKD